MKKKLLSALLATAMTAAMLAGCGSGGAGQSSQAPSSSAAQSSEAQQSSAAQTGADKTYKIGICQLVEHPALDAATKGFQDALKDKLGDKVIFDLKNAQNEPNLNATICNGFVSDKVDLILANATPSLQAAAAATTTIPVLGTSVTDYATALEIKDWTGKTGRNISGTSDLAPIVEQEKMLVELFPKAKKVGLLYCSAEPNSLYQIKLFGEALKKDNVAFKEFAIADTNEVQSVVTAAIAECDVLYIPTDNTLASCTETIYNIVNPAKIPIIAGEEGICSGCGVATLSISYYDIGRISGEMAYEILVEGKDVSTMDVRFAPQVTKKYNKKACEDLGIQVPSDYVAIQ